MVVGVDGERGGVADRVVQSVKVEHLPSDPLEGREYDILGIRLEGESFVGISHADDRKPLTEIIPEEVYESVAAAVRDCIDIEALEPRHGDGG